MPSAENNCKNTKYLVIFFPFFIRGAWPCSASASNFLRLLRLIARRIESLDYFSIHVYGLVHEDESLCNERSLEQFWGIHSPCQDRIGVINIPVAQWMQQLTHTSHTRQLIFRIGVSRAALWHCIAYDRIRFSKSKGIWGGAYAHFARSSCMYGKFSVEGMQDVNDKHTHSLKSIKLLPLHPK